MCNPNPNEIGWIRLYRKMTEWRWYGMPNMMAVFIHLLLTANHKDGYSFGIDVKRGQVLTSEASIMRSIKIKRGALRVCLKNLEETGEIVREATNKYSIITIRNYDSYQGISKNNNQQDEKAVFEVFRKAYPGKKRGLETEFAHFKKHKDWEAVLPLLLPAAQAYAEQTRETPKGYIKSLKAWIDDRCWEIESGTNNLQQSDERNRTYRQNGISPAGDGITLPNGNTYH